ncbi:WGR domain-containing protein [Sphingomonas melonis]|uniref:WGR domain-containing protein n=1 Tax=Sphingomonas melonis TaxID=152682 RepID=UPI000870D020|nr:WGR domain-containing protein [Sphingomonas melonis]AOW24495.1 hypothetical protein BJP26_13695 [Sphingomonas melonis TY]
METLPFIPIELVAIDAARNMRRRWSVAAYRDLLGAWVIETRWGRIGAGGRCLVRSFDDEGAARGYVQGLLARRAGRCGGSGWLIGPLRLHLDVSTVLQS